MIFVPCLGKNCALPSAQKNTLAVTIVTIGQPFLRIISGVEIFGVYGVLNTIIIIYTYLYIYSTSLADRVKKSGVICHNCHKTGPQGARGRFSRSKRPFRSEQEAVPLGARGRFARSKKRPQKAQGRFASSKIGFFNSLHEIIWKRLFFFVSLQPKRVYKAARLAFVSFRQWTLRHTISMYY